MKTSPLIVAVILLVACTPSGGSQAQADDKPQPSNPNHVVCQEGGRTVIDDYADAGVPVYTSQGVTDYVSATTSLRLRSTGACTVVEVPVMPRTRNTIVPGIADGTQSNSAR